MSNRIGGEKVLSSWLLEETKNALQFETCLDSDTDKYHSQVFSIASLRPGMLAGHRTDRFTNGLKAGILLQQTPHFVTWDTRATGWESLNGSKHSLSSSLPLQPRRWRNSFTFFKEFVENRLRVKPTIECNAEQRVITVAWIRCFSFEFLYS